MALFPSLRDYYNPIQPKVRHNAITYNEILPHPNLSSFIYCYWQLKSLNHLREPFFYRVVPDGCIDIYFDLNSPDLSYITGFASTYIEFPLNLYFNYAGIRFLPGAFPLLFNVKASELTDRSEDLRLVLNGMANELMIEFDRSEATEVMEVFDRFFLMKLRNQTLSPDYRFYNALSLILRQSGTVNLKSDIDTGISPRQLRRLFEFYIGDSPKIFCRVVRFQKVLNSHSLLKNEMPHDTGYYDQAHFIKEFKALFGLTPTEAFAS